jgi:aryl-phospho-beta-D-glucosidase BglC (GH1 family)
MKRLQKYSVNVLFIVVIQGLLNAAGLHTAGGDLFDAHNNKVRLTGVNWFGMETSNMCPHGLWARDWKGMLLQIKDMGFNCVRLPWCNAMLRNGASASSINFYGVDPYRKNATTDMNKELAGKSPLEILDIIVSGCEELGIAVILDNHSRDPDGYMNEQVWYTKSTSDSQWIADWVFLATRYENNPAVVGCDLDNEPHGDSSSGGSQWGGDSKYDWKSAAERCGNAILAVNPNVLILVEGVEHFGTTAYWWGGNFRGAHDSPVVLADMSKLVYSPHDYGPEVFAQLWFDDPSFPANLSAIWDSAFAFIKNQNKGHILLGEFGIRDSSSANGKEISWFRTLLSTLCKTISWTFWCLNPNSGDTGGLLGNDWTTPEQWKLDMLKPCMAPFIVTPTSVSTFVNRKRPHDEINVVRGRAIFNGEEFLENELALMSPSGRTMQKTKGVGTIAIPLKDVRNGVYICAVHNKDGVVTATRLLSIMQ